LTRARFAHILAAQITSRVENGAVVDDIEHDLALLRSLVARELETINHYRSLAERSSDGPARDFFLHIIEEEKFHVADVMRAIAVLDDEQAHLLDTGFVTGHAPGEIPKAAAIKPARESESPRPAARVTPARARGLTVGSLRGVAQ
jgi:hypothetical protein